MSASSGWTTPGDIRDHLLRLWERGRLLVPGDEGGLPFPMRIPVRGPARRALGERFPEVRHWIRELEEGSRAADGTYEIEWEEINHRQLGRNRLPRAVLLPTQGAALALIGKKREAARFAALAQATTASEPALMAWVARRPLQLLEHAEDWDRILGVVGWFRKHPRSGLYLRQLDVRGVDTKFVEARLGLFSELLDLALPPEAIDATAAGAKGFEARYGLRPKPLLVRLRLLDPGLFLAGLSDLTAPAGELARLQLPIERVFIVENDVTGLAFPSVKGAALIFGGGYGLDRLASIEWLRRIPSFYWGDLDTHGMALLGHMRGILPGVCSFLMDQATLLELREHWVQEQEHQRHLGPVERLTRNEKLLFDGLRRDTWGERVRLEQERIPFARLEEALRNLEGGPRQC